MRRDFAVALSVANLWFLKWWKYLIVEGNHYYWKEPAEWTAYVAIMVNVLLLAVVMCGAMQLARRHGGDRLLAVGRWTLLLITLVVINSARREFYLTHAALMRLLGPAPAVMAVFSLILLGAFIVVRWRDRLLRGDLALALLPLAFVTFGRATVLLVQSGSMERPVLAARLVAAPPDVPRIVWIVFDEFDQRLAFSKEQRLVDMPELDRFAGEALVATNAYPPAEHTRESMVALISGRKVVKGEPVDANGFEVTFEDSGEVVRWEAEPSVFTDARSRGQQTAAVGWFHPYCRVLASSLTHCTWDPLHSPYRNGSLLETMITQVRSLPTVVPFASFVYRDPHTQPSDADERAAQLSRYESLLGAARVAASDPTIGLVLAHLPVPHSPYIFDRTSGVITAGAASSYRPTYLDNLLLADRAFGELRQSMERAGVWDRTTVLVSGDHSLRGAQQCYGRHDERVPFMLKLPGQREPRTVDAPFNTVRTRGLFAALSSGAVVSPDSAVRWLSSRDRASPSAQRGSAAAPRESGRQ